MEIEAAVFLAAFHTATCPIERQKYWQMFLRASGQVAANPETIKKVVTTAVEKTGGNVLKGACMQSLLKGLAENFGKIAIGEGTAARMATGRVVAGRVAGAIVGWPAVAAAALLSLGCTSQDMKDAAQGDQDAAWLYKMYLERYVRWSARRMAQKSNAMIPAPWTFEEFRQYQGTMKLPY